MSIKEILPRKDITDRLLSAALLLAVIIALCVTIFVISAPKENERFTDFFILGKNMTADEYPNQVVTGQQYPIYIGIGNHESVETTYYIEVWGMNIEFVNETESTRILAMDWDESISRTLAENETSLIPYNLSIRKAEYNRVEFLLFKGDIPRPEITGPDRINASYRNLYLWIAVM